MAQNTKPKNLQEWFEVNIWALVVGIAIAVSVGGIVEIVPLFTIDKTMEHKSTAPEIVWKREAGESLSDWAPGDGIRPYTPLELAGRDVYLREGCYLCHSQMIRPFRDEKERYGHYSLASESMYDHPFQWGSKRTGPDLARVGGKYSDIWQRKHLREPRSVVPESVMPNYPWLQHAEINPEKVQASMRGMMTIGVPYIEADIESAPAEVQGKTEEDAIVAYLQVLGTMAKLDDNKVYRE
ncbi:cytochrome-c oxidase, cbb3-type subunit II [Motiliproteus sp. SC1-56]|uniref:cytochrome-c oxidase, cbb3-type subunit II n=1 Tax=Motiliproteus sp. SC1-56 TaxID=2799565 RepID=UPI001A8C2511|nr:cytochrome-c oxidase, cbb3-type subunit II [Motiliproteus sp. SC1-56]